MGIIVENQCNNFHTHPRCAWYPELKRDSESVLAKLIVKEGAKGPQSIVSGCLQASCSLSLETQ
jgi:hypothetical protein